MDFSTQQLRQQLLSLAIQGKLVPQIAEEGNAQDLLHKIEAERKKSNSKYKSLPPVTDEEEPFKIPESWVWVRLGEIFFTTSGGTPLKGHPEFYVNGTIPWVKSGELKSKYLYNAETLITEEALKNSSAKYFPVNTVAVAMYGATIGKTSIFKNELTTNQAICGIFPNTHILPEYLYYFIQAKIQDYLSIAFGSGQPNISQEKIKETLFPLPPLAEQKRIVEKLEALLGELDTIEQTKEQIEHYAEQLQGQILQTAIQGKLVPQIASEGNAKDLLHKIETERKKSNPKYKPLPPVTDEEKPFEIPESWCWCRLGNISLFNGGFAFKSEKYVEKSKGIRVLRISDFDENGINEKRPAYYPYDDKLEGYKLSVNDIVMCMTGGTVGKSFLVKHLDEDFYVNQRVADIKISHSVSTEYVYYVIRSENIQKTIQKSKNSTNDNISADLIKNFFIPLPPLSEQKRIVAKLEELLGEVEKLKR